MVICMSLAASEVPQWVLDGILYTETKSYFNKDGTITYVDKRRGLHGERGAFQCTLAAFNDVKHSGEYFFQVELSPTFAKEITLRYLLWIDKNYSHGNWDLAVRRYNAGKHHSTQAARDYLSKVICGSIRRNCMQQSKMQKDN